MKTNHGSSQTSSTFTTWIVVLALGLPGGALAEDLKEPQEFTAQDGSLVTELRTKLWEDVTFDSRYSENGKNKCWELKTATGDLRMYGYPATSADCSQAGGTYEGGFCYTFPGPTYRMSRTFSTPGSQPILGDRYELTLENHLPPTTHEAAMTCQVGGVPYDWDETPNCFHGAEVTNHHFHGFHVSPNPNLDGTTYSDYIYVKVFPQGSPGVTTEFPDVQAGSATYKLDPLSEGQHEGTHWYHPHKHGATAMQVGNGMSGAFIVEGPYDDWVREQVCVGSADLDCTLTERVLVVQEILSKLFFLPGVEVSGELKSGATNSDALVNGQLYPKVQIAPGEVQRWRIVNAAMKAAGAFYFTFPPGIEARQIGMDGIPFVKANYERQPLLGSWNGTTCTIPAIGIATGQLCILMQPGNRADFLVKRPPQKFKKLRKAEKRRVKLGVRLEADTISAAEVRDFFASDLFERRSREVDGKPFDVSCYNPPMSYMTQPGLFELNACLSPGEPGCEQQSMHFPDTATYPQMPSLNDIPSIDGGRSIIYKIEGYTGATMPSKCTDPTSCTDAQNALLEEIQHEVGACKLLLPKFTINGELFQSDVVNQTMPVNTSEQWAFLNESAAPTFTIADAATDCDKLVPYLTEDCPGGESICLKSIANDDVKVALPIPKAIQHPVHLHVNPFQVRDCLDGRKCGSPYVWQDVMGLDISNTSEATMRTTFSEYTGQFVMHCHILGHEDRGMMQNLVVEP